MSFHAKSGARTRQRLISCGIALGMAAILVLLHFLVSLLPWRARGFQLGQQTAFQISATTKNAIARLDEDVQLYLVTADGELNVDRNLYALLKSYETMSDRISLSVVSDKAEPDFLSSRGYELDEGGVAFLVESERRSRLISLEDVYYYHCVSTAGGEEAPIDFTPSEYYEYGSGYLASGGSVEARFDAEYMLTNAITFVALPDVITVAVLENDTNYPADETILRQLVRNNYEICRIGSTTELDAKRHDLLLYNTPLSDLQSDAEAEALSDYLAAGGDLFLTTYYGTHATARLAGVLAELGLSADEQGVRLVENNQNYSLSLGSSRYMFAKISSVHAASVGFDGAYLTSDAHAIKIEQKEGVTSTAWLYTTESASRERVDSSTDKATAIEEERTSYVFGAIAERGDCRVIWVSTPHALSRAHDIFNAGDNLKLMLSAMEWSVGDNGETGVIELDAQKVQTSYLMVTWTELIVWAIVLVGVLPLTVLTVGLVRSYLRRRA